MTTKPTRFQAGTFLEVDDLKGGRRVVMICKDGVTFWDSMKPETATPVALHPVFNSVELGTFTEFTNRKNLQNATKALIDYMRLNMDSRIENDPLYSMRVMWFVAQKGEGEDFIPDTETLAWACKSANEQEDAAIEIHHLAMKYYETAEA